MNTEEQAQFKWEYCPKCGRYALLRPVGRYGTDNMKYKCAKCRRWCLDQETRQKLTEGTKIFV